MEKLKRQRVWVCWKYVSKGGRMTKVPFTYTGKATGTSPEHGGEWTDYETAHAAAQMPEMGFDGIGFVMPEGYFLLDVDLTVTVSGSHAKEAVECYTISE